MWKGLRPFILFPKSIRKAPLFYFQFKPRRLNGKVFLSHVYRALYSLYIRSNKSFMPMLYLADMKKVNYFLPDIPLSVVLLPVTPGVIPLPLPLIPLLLQQMLQNSGNSWNAGKIDIKRVERLLISIWLLLNERVVSLS